jgi:hypothetical protein
MATWAMYRILIEWRVGNDRNQSAIGILSVATLIAVGLVSLYFVDYRSPNAPARPAWIDAAQYCLACVAISCGPGATPLSPYVEWALLGLGFVAAASLIRSWWSCPAGRAHTTGLLLFGISFVGLIAALGWGRSGFAQHYGIFPRYAVVTAPALCWLYLVWSVQKPQMLGPVIQVTLFALVAGVLALNTEHGLTWAKERRQLCERVKRDVRAGLPAGVIAARHPDLHPKPEKVAIWMDMLRRAEIGRFKSLPAP